MVRRILRVGDGGVGVERPEDGRVLGVGRVGARPGDPSVLLRRPPLPCPCRPPPTGRPGPGRPPVRDALLRVHPPVTPTTRGRLSLLPPAGVGRP